MKKSKKAWTIVLVNTESFNRADVISVRKSPTLFYEYNDLSYRVIDVFPKRRMAVAVHP